MTVRPLAENGIWQFKTQKEYLCIRDGEEMGFTADEFKAAQHEGWEKQYQYRLGKKKVYMPPSAAQEQGLERVSKTPKSTRFGRQNPIAARWNSDEQIVAWRKAWADTVNLHLRQRQAEGIAAAKARNVHFGRQAMQRPAEFEELRLLWKQGEISAREAAKHLNISHNTSLRWSREVV